MVQTVTGEIAAEELGIVLMHEHVILRSPGVSENYPETYPIEIVAQMCSESLRRTREAHGVRSLIDHSTVELGRDPRLLREVSLRSGVNIVACTGLWCEPPVYFHRRSPSHAAEMFIRDVTEGMAGSGIRAGIVKCGIDDAGLSAPVETGIRAAALVHMQTGVPITAHTSTENAGGEIVAQILAEEGVDMRAVVLGHCGDTDDLEYLLGLLKRGVWLGMDRFGWQDKLPDEDRVGVVAELCRQGYSGQLLLSHDASCWSAMNPDEYRRSVRPDLYLGRIFDYVLPELRVAGVSEAEIVEMLMDNPRRVFDSSS